jgi:exonuclease-1
MGVPQLLPQLKDIQETVSLEAFRGKTLAIDSYSWLHKSVMSCPVELGQGLYTDRYVNYFRKRIRMFRNFGIEPYFVFDGDKFASKNDTEDERERLRQENRKLALKCVQDGNQKGAWKHFLLCVDVTPQMAKSVIEMLKMEEIKFIVAPYEADPQMVYLEKMGLVDGILSEDSDLLIFGAKCLLTKLNDTGFCCLIRRDDFSKCKIAPVGLLSDSQLRMVACLAGCDYTNGIPSIGIVKAFRLVKRMGTMRKCLASLKLEGKITIPKHFELEYEKADLSFQYQRVFNPIINDVSTLNDIPESLEQHVHLNECIGPLYDSEIHRGIAHGEIDPLTKTKLETREVMLAHFRAKNSDVTKATPATRSFTSPPVPKMRVKAHSIDSFFKINTGLSNERQFFNKRNEAISSTMTKRRKLFNQDAIRGTQSKFFKGKDIVQQDKKTRVTFKTPDPKLFETFPSSDFDLTDPDDDPDKTGPKEKGSLTVEHMDMTEDISETRSKDLPSLIRPSRLIGAIVQNSPTLNNHQQSDEADRLIKAGLFEKFGFKKSANKESTETRPPLQPKVQNSMIGPSVTTVKTKRGTTKNLTLDHFIYRG